MRVERIMTAEGMRTPDRACDSSGDNGCSLHRSCAAWRCWLKLIAPSVVDRMAARAIRERY